MKDEVPIKVCDCRKQLGIGASLMSAILRGMKVPPRTRRVLKSRVAKFMRDNEGFRIIDGYPKNQTSA